MYSHPLHRVELEPPGGRLGAQQSVRPGREPGPQPEHSSVQWSAASLIALVSPQLRQEGGEMLDRVGILSDVEVEAALQLRSL